MLSYVEKKIPARRDMLGEADGAVDPWTQRTGWQCCQNNTANALIESSQSQWLVL